MNSYSQKLRDPRWQKKRLCVMQRDNFACRDCGDDKNTLNVHHCSYAKGGPWNTPDEHLLTLCEPCHAQRGESEDQLKTMFAEALATLPLCAIFGIIAHQGSTCLWDFRSEALRLVISKNKTSQRLVNEWYERMNKAEANT